MNIDIIRRRSVRGWELRNGIETTTQMLTAAMSLRNVKLEWRDMPTAAISKDGTLILRNIADDAVISQKDVRQYVGFVIHELLHWQKTDFFTFENVGKTDRYLGRIMNALEDARIEKEGIANCEVGNIKEVLQHLLEQMVNEANASSVDWSDPAQYPFSLAVYTRKYCARVPVPENLIPIWDQASVMLDGATNTADTAKIAKWVYGQLQLLPKQSQQQKNDDKGSDDKGTDDKQDTPQNPSNGPTSADQDRGKGEGTPSPARRPTPGQESMAVEPEQPKAGQDESHYNGAFTSEARGSSEKFLHDDRNNLAVTYPVPGKLRYEVRKMFENTARTLFNKNRTTGALDVSNLSKVATGSSKVFSKRQEIEGISSAVVILIDQSGSMSDNSRLIHAAQTAFQLYETLTKAGVKVQIVGFSSIEKILVPFGTRTINAKQIIGKMKEISITNDYIAIRRCHDMLNKRNEQRKVLFVLTDGRGNVQATRKQCEIANRLGITTIGIGIGISVEAAYPQSVTIYDPSKMGAVSFQQIKVAA